MTDSGGPQRRTLCFLSTLLSQKIPEKSDAVLRCMISGQPKPEVTWYKNGRTIDNCGIVSSYEFFENQYIHVLHLSCCTPEDTAVYQISAKNCFGMICCSASIEVECSSENLQLSPSPKDEGDAGWNREMETYEQENTSQIDEKEHPYREEERIASGPPTSADSPSSQFDGPCSLQLLANNDLDVSSSENLSDVKDTRQTEEACDPNHRKETADGLLFPNSSNIPSKEGGFCHRIVHSRVSRLMEGALECNGPNEEDLNSSHHNPKVQKYISFSLPLTEAASSTSPGDRSTVNKPISPPASSIDSDSDYELCPEITLTYTEEFSDDDLEYLECSDVMTDYSNAVWQRNLQGTGHVFLLESDDEEMEFHECGLGGCERFLSEMGCGPLVSDDTGPMDATTGLRGHHSPPQEVGVRSSLASTGCASSQQTGMTLTLGPHRDGTSMVTDQGRSNAPAASEAAENGYSGIPGETRDSQAGEGFASDNLLTMDKAVTGRKGKSLSGEFRKSGMNQCWESAAEERAAGKDSLSRRSTEKPARARPPGVKGRARKLNPNLDERAAEASLNRLCPKGPVKHPCTPSDQRASSHARADATDLNSQLPAGGCAVPAQAEQGAETFQTPSGLLPSEGSLDFWGEGVWIKNVYEASLVPYRSDQPQVQIQETGRERISLSRMPAFSESASTRTTTNSFPNLGGTHKENASLTQYLEAENCARDPQQEENQDGAGHAPGRSWGDLGPAPNTPEASSENMPLCELSVHLPQGNSPAPRGPQLPSVTSPELVHTVPTLEALCDGPRDREAAWGTECLEAGDQETCDTMGSLVGAPVGKYLPQEICSMDSELAGQYKVSDLWSPDDKTLDVLLQTGGSEPPWSTCESSKERNSAVPPLFISTFTWNLAPRASKDAPGDNLAKAENSTSALASMVKAGQERLSPSNSGWLEERQPPSSENGSPVGFKEGRDEGSRAQETADTWASRSSIVFSQEAPTMLTANLECAEATGEDRDTSALSTATKVHPLKYLPVSMAGNSQAGGLESLPRASGENISHLPPDTQLGRTLNSTATESSKELPQVAPSGPEARVCVPQPPEGEGLCGSSPVQMDDWSGKRQTLHRADARSLDENFPEKGSETTQGAQQGSPDADFQESLPTASVQGEINLVPLDNSAANSREERGQSPGLGTSVSMVAESTTESARGALSNVPPLCNLLPEGSKESGPGYGEAGRKLKIITLEASVSETWPPRQRTGSKCNELEGGLMIPDRVWAASDVLKAGAAMPELASPEAASSCSPQTGPGSASANKRDIHGGKDKASNTHWSSLPSQYLSQPRLLESSVDPVDEMELCVSDLLPEASKTGRRENVNVSRNALAIERPAFLKQFLACPQILESSVDPIEGPGMMEWKARVETPELPEPPLEVRVERKLNVGNLAQRVDVQPAVWQVLCPQPSGENIPNENSITQDQEDSERGEAGQSQHDKAKGDVQSAILPAPGPVEGREAIPSRCSRSPVEGGIERRSGEPEPRKNDKAELVFPILPLSSHLAVMTPASVGAESHHSTGQGHDVPGNDLREPRSQNACSDSERGAVKSEYGSHLPPSSGLTQGALTSSEGSVTDFSRSHDIEECKREGPPIGESKPPGTSGSLTVTLALISGEGASEKVPKVLQGPCQQGSTLGHGEKLGEEKAGHVVAQAGSLPGAPPAGTGSEKVKEKQATPGSGRLAEGVKKKILSRVAALRLRLEERENVRKKTILLKKSPKLEPSVSSTDEKEDPQRPPCKPEGRAPVLLKKIQAEIFPDHPGNIKLSCQFAEIHEDSTVMWTKDSKLIAQAQRRAGDDSAVSLAIVQAGQKDQGLYYCCINNSYGKVTAEFNLTAEVLKQLSSHPDVKGYEEIEFSQLIFEEDFLNGSYFGGHLRGQIATEQLHFGEGVHRKAFRSTVMQGLMPVFEPGHACVLKVHNAVAYGTRNNDELIQRNYKLAAQECYVQNTARYYAKIYAAEAQPLEGFGEVPEIIPIFLIHRPENNIPYATVEEELIGEFVKYSIRDGKEINFLRRESEAGQKCCTFQHWVYQKTSGCLLVTDMQGVGMKLTDVGIATLAKGYKGFKGNCSMTFIDQFKALHQCNKYCKMLGLKSLQNNNQKPKKPSIGKGKIQPNSTTVKKLASGAPVEKRT
ncbi:alpha-protein kinase 2 isoform X1 [Phacochoerus africanus]|uniref:alpha-protein kinase 2 isoform X1 n=1 Tax=Phacochoerus africanus TaxID=41426 RepID=UPI001FD9ACA5|nr:alpha-protein kinase 2 isoform X1 [Phacochoerus africanus]